MVLPAYLFNSGLGSKVSTWLAPPCMKIQMTLLALGAKCGFPSGGVQTAGSSAARRIPCRCKMAPSARPVNPMPQSARNVRRRIFPHEPACTICRSIIKPLSDGHKLGMVQQRVHQVFTRSQMGIGRRRDLRGGRCLELCQSFGFAEKFGSLLQKLFV